MIATTQPATTPMAVHAGWPARAKGTVNARQTGSKEGIREQQDVVEDDHEQSTQGKRLVKRLHPRRHAGSTAILASISASTPLLASTLAWTRRSMPAGR